ncbi:shikimate dehydrogenase family protein [Xanthobacter versatilis]|uniref:shikimate dehydrogenase family protein n=1 Tax=Xanthobacter autotrophicus (strain ATCC BAA-1158 / Py2) TaxID=78245 RepID=UPI00372BB1D8
MNIDLSGATRLYIIVGDPIAQVKSPAGMTAAFLSRNHDGILVPVQVGTGDLGDLLAVSGKLKNLGGVVVTVPHKFGCFSHCAEASDRAAFIGSVNIMRQRPEGGWYGDIVDGLGFVSAAVNAGFDPAGKRALLVGAGGAGSAIALALIDAGVAELAIHDADVARRDALVARLNTLGKGRAVAGSTDPAGFDLVANATPMGMKEGDPLPLDVTRLAPATHVGCVITQPAVSPLIAAARAAGCPTSTGTEMYFALQEKMVDFLLHTDSNA